MCHREIATQQPAALLAWGTFSLHRSEFSVALGRHGLDAVHATESKLTLCLAFLGAPWHTYYKVKRPRERAPQVPGNPQAHHQQGRGGLLSPPNACVHLGTCTWQVAVGPSISTMMSWWCHCFSEPHKPSHKPALIFLRGITDVKFSRQSARSRLWFLSAISYLYKKRKSTCTNGDFLLPPHPPKR